MRVLVAFDFSEASLEALEQGRAEAKASGGSLAVVHVLPVLFETEPFFSQFRQEAAFDLGASERDARSALEKKMRSLVGAEPLEIFVDRGIPYADVVRRAEAWGADLVVVGSHGRSGIARALLGSVAERIVRHAHGPVLVARPIEKSGVVLAATDLSEASLPVVEVAARAAERRNARLIVVSAVDFSYAAWGAVAGAPFGPTPAVPPVDVQLQMRGAIQEGLKRELERVGTKGDVVVLDGTPASAIAEKAQEVGAELVVVGTHGRTGFARLALGSVAERVVRAAPCSVYVARRAEAPRPANHPRSA